MPMVYWRRTDTYAGWTDFCALVDNHVANRGGRFVYIGSDLNAAGDANAIVKKKKKDYESASEMVGQIDYTRNAGANGWTLYDYATLETTDYWDELLGGPFAAPAVSPYLWWMAPAWSDE